MIADASAKAFFEVFSLMDAVADPELAPHKGTWLGIDTTPGIPDEPDFPMLHDEFFERWWNFKKLAVRAKDLSRP